MLSPLLGEETEQEIVFKTRQTVLKMMEKRGYTVPKKNAHFVPRIFTGI